MENTDDYNVIADAINDSLNEKNKDLKNAKILGIIQSNNFLQRCQAAYAFKEKFNTDLQEAFKKQLKGDFLDLSSLLFLNPIEQDIKYIQASFKKFSADEKPIIEILTSRCFEYLKVLEKQYNEETQGDLAKDIQKKMPGEIKKQLCLFLEVPRNENTQPDLNEIETYVNKLINSKSGDWVKDEELFKEVFLKLSCNELVALGRMYLKKTGTHFLDAIEKKLKGAPKKLITEIMYNNINPHELFAEKLKESMVGIGTDEETLNRVLATRCELDMKLIKEIYNLKNKKTLEETIKGDTSGSYQSLCLFLHDK